MSDKTGIEWCDATWNPIVGCSVVSPGCTNCYAMKMAARIERMNFGLHVRQAPSVEAVPPSVYDGLTRETKAGPVWTGEVRLARENVLTQPLRWKGTRAIFVNSMGDLFHENVPDAWIDRVFAVMALAPQHTFIVLTKRARRMRHWFDDERSIPVGNLCSEMRAAGFGAPPNGVGPLGHLQPGDHWWPLSNVVLGVSAERQQEADERIPDLLATPAAKRVVSAEPLLGQIDFLGDNMEGPLTNGEPTAEQIANDTTGWRVIRYGVSRLDGIIVGGESGPGARPMHPDWARAIRDQCAAAGVPFFFKQWGEWATGSTLLTTGQPIFRTFNSFQEWVNKASTRVRGGACLDRLGQNLKCGADFMRARDENAFPVTILDRVGKHAAGRLLDGREHNDLPWTRVK